MRLNTKTSLNTNTQKHSQTNHVEHNMKIHKTQTKDVKHVVECIHHRLSSNLKP